METIIEFASATQPFLALATKSFDEDKILVSVKYEPSDGTFYCNYTLPFTSKTYKLAISSKDTLLHLLGIWYNSVTTFRIITIAVTPKAPDETLHISQNNNIVIEQIKKESDRSCLGSNDFLAIISKYLDIISNIRVLH